MEVGWMTKHIDDTPFRESYWHMNHEPKPKNTRQHFYLNQYVRWNDVSESLEAYNMSNKLWVLFDVDSDPKKFIRTFFKSDLPQWKIWRKLIRYGK
jgi:hypothetical protein